MPPAVPGALPYVILKHESGAAARIYVYAAHLANWTTPDGEEQLYLSSKTAFGGGKAIRGGVPICCTPLPCSNRRTTSGLATHMTAPTLEQGRSLASVVLASGTASCAPATGGL